MTRRRPQKHGPHDRRSSSPGKSQRKGRAQRRGPVPVPRGGRLWVWRALCVLAAPVAFILLLEGGLFLGGVGYPTSFFIRSEQRGVLTTNVRFGWHYQQETLTDPVPCRVPAVKPEDAIRIFVLGESAAMGTPDPSFGFARILEVMLGTAFPRQRFEVINAAMRGINSHVIVPIARECAGLDPDLFIVYMGNNELNGLYGPQTPVAFFGRHPALIPAFHRIKQMRTAQLLRRALGVNPEALQSKRKPPAPEFFRRQRLALDDPRRDHVYANFRRNLERICGYGTEAGAAVILATAAVNLRDFPPLGSLPRSDLAGPQRQQWERLYRTGAGFETAGDVSRALAHYQQAAALDDHYAELHFRLARCHLRTGDPDAARRHFLLARDWDALQLRADARLNDIVRDVATTLAAGAAGRRDGRAKAAGPGGGREGHVAQPPPAEFGSPLESGALAGRSIPEGGGATGAALGDDIPVTTGRVALVDTEAALAASERCPDGIPGREFFYEHVHLRFDGDYEVAKALWPAVLACLRERGLTAAEPVRLPARQECAAALAFTAWDEVNTAAAMAQLTAKPPFTEQLEHARRQADQEEAVSAVMSGVDQAFVQQVIQTYHRALDARPQDWHLRYNLGTFLHQLERPQEAAVHLDAVVQTFPHVPSFRILLGYALGQAGRPDQALEQFRQALKRDRRNKEARDGLTWAQALKKRTGR